MARRRRSRGARRRDVRLERHRVFCSRCSSRRSRRCSSASILARRIARPIERLADAAQRTAEGDLRATAPVEGPAEVRALANAFNVMVDRLAEQDAVRREFVVNASHELRTPLTNLQGYLEALRDGVLPPDPAMFDSLREEVDRLTRLASSLDVLAGARRRAPDAGGHSTSAALVRGARRARGAVVRPPVDRGDRGRRARIARCAGPLRRARPGRWRTCSRTRSGTRRPAVASRSPRPRRPGRAVVRVSNTGGEIPPEDLPRVWERFFRVEQSRDRDAAGRASASRS